MSAKKTCLSFILADPADHDVKVEARDEPRHANSRLLLPPLSKKRALATDATSPVETRAVLGMSCSPTHHKTKPAILRRHKTKPTNDEDGAASPSSTSSLKTPVGKRTYNRERQQTLRTQDRQERQTLRSKVEQLEATWARLQQQRQQRQQRLDHGPEMPVSNPADRSVPDSTVKLHEVLASRTRQYAHFTHDLAHWASMLQHQTRGDMLWVASLDAASYSRRSGFSRHDHARSSATSVGGSMTPISTPCPEIKGPGKAKPLPPLKVDLSHLPPGSRKRMYNRLRQRLYRQRELEELDALNTYARELSEAVVRLRAAKAAPSRDAPRAREAHMSLQDAVDENATLKAKLRQHAALNHALQEWVHRVSDVMQFDFPLVASP